MRDSSSGASPGPPTDHYCSRCMDEICEDRAELIQFFNHLASTSDNLKVVISSRRDDDIKRHLETGFNFGIEATDNQDDIRTFVRDKIEKGQKARRKPLSKDLEKETINTLCQKSQGMFQWASLQVDQILSLVLEADINAQLGTLPHDLKTAYDQIFARIEGSDGSQLGIATLAFCLVLLAYQPLSPDTLLACLCRDPSTGQIKHSDLDMHFALDACANLLVVDTNTQICCFSHLSVHEYFEKHQYRCKGPRGLGNMQSGIAMISLRMLLELNDSCYLSEVSSSLRYAAEFWHQHAKQSLAHFTCEKLGDTTYLLFSDQNSTAFWHWLSIYDCDCDFSHKVPLWAHYREHIQSSHLNYPVANSGSVTCEMSPIARASPKESTTSSFNPISSNTGLYGRASDTLVPLEPEEMSSDPEKFFGHRLADSSFWNCPGYEYKISDGPLYYASLLGLETTVSRLLDETPGAFQKHGNHWAALAAAINCRIGTLQLLLDRGCHLDLTHIFWILANIDGDMTESLDFLLRSETLTSAYPDADTKEVQEALNKAILQSAAENESCGDKVMQELFKSGDIGLEITESAMKVAAANPSCGNRVLDVFLAHGRSRLPTEWVIKMAISNKRLAVKIPSTILDVHQASIAITVPVVHGAALNWMTGEDGISFLLRRQTPELHLTQDAFEEIALRFSPSVMSIILHEREQKPTITERVVEAALTNESWREELINIFLYMRCQEIPLNTSLVRAVACSRAEDIKNARKVLFAPSATPNILSNHLTPPKPSETVSTTYPPAANSTKQKYVSKGNEEVDFTGERISKLLLRQKVSKKQILEAFVIEIAKRFRENVMSALLDEAGEISPITESVLAGAISNKRHAFQMVKLLLDRTTNLPITAKFIDLAADNKECGEDILAILRSRI